MNRIRPIVFFTSLLVMLSWCSITFAQGAAPIDPTHPAVAARTAQQLVAHYGLPWALMFVAVGVGSWFVRRNDGEHWLAQGRVLHLISAAVGLGGAAIDARWNGGSWQALATFAPGILALLWERPEPNSARKTTAGGVITTSLVLLVATLASCGPATKRIVADAEACLAASAANGFDALRRDVESILTNPSGASWRQELDALFEGAEAAGIEGGASAVICAATAARDDLLSKVRPEVGSDATATSSEAMGASRAGEWLAAR